MNHRHPIKISHRAIRNPGLGKNILCKNREKSARTALSADGVIFQVSPVEVRFSVIGFPGYIIEPGADPDSLPALDAS